MSMQNQWHAMRGFSRDPSVTKQRLKPGTVRRITGYARPYRLDLAIFLVAAALDAVVTVLVPRPASASSSTRASCPRTAPSCSRSRASSPASLSSTRFLGVVQRYFTSRVGEGLIYDLRTQVFEHVQRQPIAFFTRAQTGSLVSQAQQRRHRRAAGAHVHPVVGGVQRAAARARPGRHVRLLLAGDGCRAGPDSDLPVPGPPGRAQAPAADQGIDAARRPDGLDHDRAVQRGRGDARQAVRAARRGGRPVLRPGRPGTRHRRAARPCGAARW